MELASFGMLAGIGLVGGFMAGFLGIGGGIVMIPLLMYGAGLPMKLVTGISMVQAFFATSSGLLIHRRNRTIDVRLGAILGTAGVIGALVGSVGSSMLSGRTLLSLYMLLVTIAVGLLVFAPRTEKAKETPVKAWHAFPLGLGVGILAGMLGVGGGFIMTPLMISVLRIPTKVAVGTSLLMILPTTFAGATGKIATGQFDLAIAAAVIVGSVIGAQFGGRVNSRVSPRAIRASLALLLVGIMIRTGIDLFTAA
ncbi:MAG: sulfite exporter TauE/SafE family protein [Chloroflexi bacterium]|nr:sulfite exporter TauE/SafE family protein [Chloroflexota bacterium]